MLFFTRAFICIGAIVALAEGFDGAALVRETSTATDALIPAELKPVAALCRTKPDACLAIASAATATLPAVATGGTLGAAPLRATATRRASGRPPELSSRAVEPR